MPHRGAPLTPSVPCDVHRAIAKPQEEAPEGQRSLFHDLNQPKRREICQLTLQNALSLAQQLTFHQKKRPNSDWST